MKDKTITFETTNEEQKEVRKIKKGELSLERLDEILKSATGRAGRRKK